MFTLTVRRGKRMRIRRSHNLGLEEARRRADEIAADLKQQYSLTSAWAGDVLEVRGTAVNGQLVVAAESVELVVRLGFALRIMEGPIRTAIENTIDQHLD